MVAATDGHLSRGVVLIADQELKPKGTKLSERPIGQHGESLGRNPPTSGRQPTLTLIVGENNSGNRRSRAGTGRPETAPRSPIGPSCSTSIEWRAARPDRDELYRELIDEAAAHHLLDVPAAT